MFNYTIGFIKRADEILLLNRESPSWMGSWNGVGGKLEKGETPLTSIIREVREETGIILDNMTFKGTVTWNVEDRYSDGMYVFIIELPDSYSYPTPLKTDEGILDWKKLDWVFHPENTGIANLQYFLSEILAGGENYDHHFFYQNNKVVKFERRKLNILEENCR